MNANKVNTTIGTQVWPLRNITIPRINPSNVTIPNLETLVIPATITNIKAGAFEECYSLKTINYTGTQEQWEAIKQKVEGRKKKSVLEEISYGLPPLLRAYKIQKKAAKKGFDWKDAEGPWDKIHEEIAELKEASSTKTQEEIQEELGDVLFSVVNLARHLKVDPVLALASTNEKFKRRFGYVEEKMESSGIEMKQENLEIMDKFWDEGKGLGL